MTKELEQPASQDTKKILLSFNERLFREYMGKFKDIKDKAYSRFKPVYNNAGLKLDNETLGWIWKLETSSNQYARANNKQIVTDRIYQDIRKDQHNETLAKVILSGFKEKISNIMDAFEHHSASDFISFRTGQTYSHFSLKWLRVNEDEAIELADGAEEEIRDLCSLYVDQDQYDAIIPVFLGFKLWYEHKYLPLMDQFGVKGNIDGIRDFYAVSEDESKLNFNFESIEWLLRMYTLKKR